MPTITARTRLDHRAVHVWPCVRDVTSLGRRAPHVLDVVTERATSRWTVLLNGSEVSWEQRDLVGPGTILRSEQVAGDLESMSCTWEVSDTTEGALVQVRIEFDLGVDGLAPLLEPMWVQSLQAHAEALLRALPTASEDA